MQDYIANYVTFKVSSVSPILMNCAKGMSEADIGDIVKLPGKKNKIPPPEVEAESKAYRLPNTWLFLDANMFRASLIEGCTGYKIENGAANKRFMGTTFTAVDICPLYKPGTMDNINNYDIDIRRAVIKEQGVRRARPKIINWETYLTFEYDPQLMDIDTIDRFLSIAGKTQGVADYRPNKRGPFGRYLVEPVAEPSAEEVLTKQVEVIDLQNEDEQTPPEALNLGYIYRNRPKVEEDEEEASENGSGAEGDKIGKKKTGVVAVVSTLVVSALANL